MDIAYTKVYDIVVEPPIYLMSSDGFITDENGDTIETVSEVGEQ